MKTETKTNELELRELDAWIAEFIFGRKWYLFDNHICQLEQPSKWQERHGGKEVDAPMMDDEKDISSVPQYHQDPAAAMQVLEKCIINQGNIGLAHGKHGDEENWLCGNEIATTLELAICLFAKKLFSE